MRIAVTPGDPGYINWIRGKEAGKVVIKLDGVEQSHITLADEEAGAVERFVLDENGKAQVDPVHGDRVWVETVRGRVEISVVERQK